MKIVWPGQPPPMFRQNGRGRMAGYVDIWAGVAENRESGSANNCCQTFSTKMFALHTFWGNGKVGKWGVGCGSGAAVPACSNACKQDLTIKF